MREEFKNINEMSDSRELLEAKPNPIMPLFIYLLIIIIVIAGIWTYFGEIDEVIKASGVIRPDEMISTVRNEVTSQVQEIYFEEGQSVEQGEILFTLNNSDQQLQKSLLEDQLNKATNKITQLKVLKKSINEEEDLFSEQEREGQFYDRYKAFQTNLKLREQENQGSTLEVSQTLEDQNIQQQQWQRQINMSQEKVKQLEKLKESIQEKENLFSKEDLIYYNRFIDIEMTLNQMENTIDEAKESYESLKNVKDTDEETEQENIEDDILIMDESLPVSLEEQIENARQIYEDAELKLDQYINQQLLQVNSELVEEEAQLDERQSMLETAKDNSEIRETQQDYYQATVENLKSDMLLQVNADITSTEQQIDQLNQELTTIEKQMNSYVVKSPTDGTVNKRMDMSSGDLLQAGTEVLTIVPKEKESNFTIQLSILNQDIANANVGDKVKLRVHSLPYQEYGHLEGEITTISTDAINEPETGLSYYLAEAIINQEELMSYKDEPANIKVGMTADAHIVTGSKKILYFLLERIDLRD